MKSRIALHFLASLLVCLRASAAAPGDYHAITVVDGQTGRGVPLVELKTVNHASWWTDSSGVRCVR